MAKLIVQWYHGVRLSQEAVALVLFYSAGAGLLTPPDDLLDAAIEVREERIKRISGSLNRSLIGNTVPILLQDMTTALARIDGDDSRYCNEGAYARA